MIGCEGVRELAQAYLEGELAPAEAERLERHIHACPACRHVVATYRQLFAAMARPAIPPVPSGFAARVLARIESAQRRRRAWQAVALTAGLLLVGGAAALITWGGLPEMLPSAAEAVPPIDTWRGAWESVVRLAEGAAAASCDWLAAVPSGLMALALLAVALAAQVFLAYRWRMLASPHGTKEARVVQ